MSQEQPSQLLDNAQIPVPKIKDGSITADTIQSWNTNKLGLRLGADAGSAATASLLVAPVITIIDQAIVRKAATSTSISASLLAATKSALLRPHGFLLSRPFLLIFSLYYGTYFTANTIDTLTSTIENKKANNVTSGPTKFAATSAVNMSLCVYKDSQFAKLFGASTSSSPASKIPKLSYALFACRDSLTIFASFNLPTIIAPRLAELPPSVKEKFSRILSTESGRTNTAQFLAPAAMQVFSTPLHLLGLDLYNRQGKLGFPERALQITKNWASCSFARMGRIIPAFGVGGVVNSNMRGGMMTRLE
ncbi:hypothetical protein PMZ80_007924 [Knufia obscura]|uniref:Sequence orphan n=2 Tax=Knufia TaxID=430999 RepID=A0AAN8EW49_9EURO|nr:hypothetical protein PMZ80_007924 [Knufia obscura]KAK5957345.1 hypothetical protein OHC33_001718 [Knufia fluminis]